MVTLKIISLNYTCKVPCIHTYLGHEKYVALLGNKFMKHQVLDYRGEDLILIKKTEE